jgi:hypothetical protein
MASQSQKNEACNNNVRGKKYLAQMGNSPYIGVYKVISGYKNDKQFAFRIGEENNKVVLREKNGTKDDPDPMESAKTLLKRHGFDETSANIIDLQASIDKTIEDDTRKVDFRDEVLFKLPEECEPAFVDMRGDQINQVYFQSMTAVMALNGPTSG